MKNTLALYISQGSNTLISFLSSGDIKKRIRITGRGARETEPYSIAQMQYPANHLNDIRDPADHLYFGLQAFHPLRLEEVLGLKHKDRQRMTIFIQCAVLILSGVLRKNHEILQSRSKTIRNPAISCRIHGADGRI